MNFSIERPWAFYGILILIPVLGFVITKYRKMVRLLAMDNSIRASKMLFSSLRLSFVFRTVCRALAWIMLVLAFAGISWGTNMVAVQKSGDAISMVFDISYSMNATDAPGGMSRLESSSRYAKELMEHLEGQSVSAVLAKGDGIIAVPLTDDYPAVESLLDSLSPKLMTSQGTDLGAGIKAAINSFPQQSSQAAHIWLFTDGDETENTLSSALSDSIKYGIPVTIIGFGTERETEVFAGDGSKVKTAMRSEKIEKIIEGVQKKNLKRGSQTATIKFIDASEVGSAFSILQDLNSKDSTVVAYEIQPVRRNGLLIFFAVIFYIVSFIFAELHLRHRSRMLAISIVAAGLMFTGCTGRFQVGKEILYGKLEWNRKGYDEAVGHFMKAIEISQETDDKDLKEYALYGLASTYLMKDEVESAVERFEQISPDAPDSVRFAVLYNSGIIAHRKGDYDKAVEDFKSALLIDGSNINAKINLEISQQQKGINAKAREQQITDVSKGSQESELEQALYSIIRENDDNKWKNQQQESESRSSRDY